MWRGFRGMIVAGLSLTVMLVLSIGLRPAPEDLPSRSGLRGIGDVRRLPRVPVRFESKVDQERDWIYFVPVPPSGWKLPHHDGRETLVVPSSP